jgi:hypothetical protein
LHLHKREHGWTGNKILPLFLLSEKEDYVIIVGVSPLTVTLQWSKQIDEAQMVI